MNILILSVGTRNLLVSYFMKSGFDKVIAVDASPLAPALYISTKYYIVPKMTDPEYLHSIEKICCVENIQVVLPLQEDELDLISRNVKWFEERKIKVVVSDIETVKICRDKYDFYLFLKSHSLPALKTYSNALEFKDALDKGEISFPIFLKPRCGCGSVNSLVANNMDFVLATLNNYKEEFIIQEYNYGKEYGIDIYCDLISGEITQVFIKEKLRMRAGETEKSISVINDSIIDLVKKTLSALKCKGPIDIDLFEMDGKYYVSEINPRFGGGYPHAYLCGINYPKSIYTNACGDINEIMIGGYKQGIIALKTQDIIVSTVREFGTFNDYNS